MLDEKSLHESLFKLRVGQVPADQRSALNLQLRSLLRDSLAEGERSFKGGNLSALYNCAKLLEYDLKRAAVVSSPGDVSGILGHIHAIKNYLSKYIEFTYEPINPQSDTLSD